MQTPVSGPTPGPSGPTNAPSGLPPTIDAMTGAFDPEMAIRIMSRHGHGGFIGLTYHAHGDDCVEIALPWRADLVGDETSGVLASGPIISLLDNATSLSVWTRRKRFVPQATLDLRIDYLRAATPGETVIAHADCYAIKRSMSFVRAIAHQGDPSNPVAHAAGIFMRTAWPS